MFGQQTHQVLLQRSIDLPGQWHRPVLAALAAADGDGARPKVDVLHPQLHALHHPYPGPVDQLAHQLRDAFQAAEHGAHFLCGQHGRQELLAFHALELVEPSGLGTQYMPVEKDECIECLRLRTGRDPLDHGQMIQKLGECFRPKLARVAFAMEQNIAPGPEDIGLGGTRTAVTTFAGKTYLAEQTGRRGRR